ncbi:MAG TPA: hypothetical protein VES97_06505 [Solirubrobacteraceae bacterium]|nr:hypothetical protein [Solirubrobacteraceae bacterium]
MSTPGDLLEALGRQARARLGGEEDASAATRVYRGRSVEELIPRIQQELGAEAIVVRRREGLTGGFLGFFQHAFVEIEAMPGTPSIDVYDEEESASPHELAPAPEPAQEADPAPELPAPAPQPPLAPAPVRPAFQYRPAQQPPLELRRQPPPSRPLAEPRHAADPFAPSEPAAPRAPGSAYVTAHLAALARAGRHESTAPAPAPIAPPAPAARVPDFQELLPRPRPEPFASTRTAPVAQPPREERRAVAPGSHSRARAGVQRSLQRLGVSEAFARELIDGASAHALPLAPRAGLAQAVRSTLVQRIPVASPLPTQGAAVVVVGPGGSGKTTCCAALLGAYRKSSTLPASCATLTRGSERGELLLILSPQIVKPTTASAPRALGALRRARGDGLAILDTPALSPADKAGIRELALLVGALEPERVVVALPATLGATAAAQLLGALRPLGANALAVTHADETDQIGVAIEAACRFGLAPEYMLDRARSGGWRLSRVDPTALAVRLLP